MIGPLETFTNESEENLTALEEALLELENDHYNNEQIDQAFRAMHTIKGSGGMFGFDFLSEFTHHLESAFDRVRQGDFEISASLISVMLDAKDCIQNMLQHPEPDAEQRIQSQAILQRLYQIIPEADDAQATGDSQSKKPAAETRKMPLTVARLQFTPVIDTFTHGMEVFPILRELAELGDCYTTTLTDSLPDLFDMDVESSYLAWDITLVTEAQVSEIRDVFIFVEDDWAIQVEEIDLQDNTADSDRLGELLLARGLISADQLESSLGKQHALGEILQQDGLVSQAQISAVLNEQRATRQAKEKVENGGKQDAIVRVPASRLDALMNLVGELVIVQARMNEIANQRGDEEILSVSEDLDLLTTEMRDHTFNIRMVPIGTTFGRFRRLVRDLSCDLHKEIRLQTFGAETELDKMVIDKLGDPLVHLIRNSIDHGIETPDERRSRGKPEYGTVSLSASHSESQVIIRIADDGRGLDAEKILAIARERGLVTEDQQRSDEDIYPLIFEPGFTTAKTVSDISGRGVGMDVVRRSIQELGGRVDIHSEMGVGTTITISLPMTLAIIEGLLVTVSGEHYVLPLGAVEECIELPEYAKPKPGGKRLVNVRGELVPYMHLREWFEVAEAGPKIEQVVIARLGDDRFGFCVDDVVGQYQTVIKRLGKLYEGVTGFSGATILGDGSVAMILDPVALMGSVETEAEAARAVLH